MNYQRHVLFVSLLLVICLVGCNGPDRVIKKPLTRDEAINSYNANVSAIGAFKANVFSWKAGWPDEHGKQKDHGDLGGKVFYVPGENSKPSSVYLETFALLDKAFVVGSNSDEFWMYIKPQKKGWWGKYEHRGKPCGEAMPVDPMLFLEFAGLGRISDKPPLPVYTVDEAFYTLQYITLINDGFQVRREYIFDRINNLPSEISAYDRDGQVLMRSRLKDYVQLGDAWLPREIEVESAGGEYYFRLKLNKLKPYKYNAMRYELLFGRPEYISGVDEYIQIDKDCDRE